ncbi:31385_t:CDS:2 [Gigaspora margarita]|uniref:31385_t:CDS:1 n=1 Tax=Gigaspora margarita TaxID=4874 RepID=A0ABM8W560_GIGMA|nr:31385_t:CDS:2 [Gigaspora margarita]
MSMTSKIILEATNGFLFLLDFKNKFDHNLGMRDNKDDAKDDSQMMI